jgi:hypothetical protein
VLGSGRWTLALPSTLKLGQSGPSVRKNTFTHTPHGGRAVWDSGTFLPYGNPRVLLPTKTSRSFNQFLGSAPHLLSGGVQDSSPFIEFLCLF